MMKKLTAVLLATLLAVLPAMAGSETLTVEADVPLHEMSGTLYGLFFEDINHAADGGLYAELLQNRSFEYEELMNPSQYQHLTGWQFNTSQAGNGKIRMMEEASIHPNNPTYVRIETDVPGYAFQNMGYSGSPFQAGIRIDEGEAYDVSIWLRGVDYSGKVTAELSNRAGVVLSNPVSWTPGEEWAKHTGTLLANASADNACLTVTVEEAGVLDADMASLMPQDRTGAEWPGGGMRTDLVEALKELSPRFLRFPGGCVTEGSWVWEIRSALWSSGKKTGTPGVICKATESGFTNISACVKKSGLCPFRWSAAECCARHGNPMSLPWMMKRWRPGSRISWISWNSH